MIVMSKCLSQPELVYHRFEAPLMFDQDVYCACV